MSLGQNPPSPRRRGRPPAAGPDQRERLLDAAIELFVERGIESAPLNAIARRAGVTPALMHYYFTSREQLVDAFIEERVMPKLQQALARLDGDGEAAVVIPQVAERLIRVMSETAWLPALWIREIAGRAGMLRERLLPRVGALLASKLRNVTESAQRRGTVNPELDPRLMLVSVVGLSVLPVALEPLWRQLPGNQDIDSDTLTRHAVAMLRHGLGVAHG